MTTHDTEIVAALRLALVERLGEQRFDVWFGAGTRLSIHSDTVCIEAGDQFTVEWLRNQFRRELEQICRQVLGETAAVQFRIDASLKQLARSTPTAVDDAQNAQPAPPRNGSGNGKQRFASLDSFEVGPGNEVAFTSASMVCRQLGQFSPLFVFGPTGVGKTHLLQGIWSQLRRDRSTRRVVYLTAEQFTTYFLEALQGSGLPNFRRKHRQTDLLIVDDIQFFQGKRATLTELAHTIDTLLQEGRQLVFAADRPLGELSRLGPELVTRLSGGLACRIQPPGQTTRLGILRRMVARRKLSVPEGVLELIAWQMPGDARLLSGALNRLQATSQARQRPITRAMAEEALMDLSQNTQQVVHLKDIERVVCDRFGLTPRSLQSASKSRSVSHPRMLAMWLARKHTRAALSEIGQFFGDRSHSTVISAQKKVNDWVSQGHQMRTSDRACAVADVLSRLEHDLRTG